MNADEKMNDEEYIQVKSNEFIDTCSWFLMRKVVRLLTNYINNSFKETGILSTQLGALAILEIKKELSISEIAKELVMDQTTATRNIMKLEKENLVKVIEGNDKRFKIITLTDKGREKLQQVLPIWDHNQQMINQAVGNEKIQNLDEILRTILHILPKN